MSLTRDTEYKTHTHTLSLYLMFSIVIETWLILIQTIVRVILHFFMTLINMRF
ncbi:unnamed protein product [Musa hybrid cultivar]